MIGVIDFDGGNIASVTNALAQVGTEFNVSAETSVLQKCNGVILPGVGAAPSAMFSLQSRDLAQFLVAGRVPTLGIDLGMQLFFTFSEEGNTTCLGVLPGSVRTINKAACKVPHIGWNEVEFLVDHPLLQGIRKKEYFYFAHSYAANVDASAGGVTDCGVRFASAVFKNNYYGVQFHPERSGSAGLTLLKNFVQLCDHFKPQPPC